MTVRDIVGRPRYILGRVKTPGGRVLEKREVVAMVKALYADRKQGKNEPLPEFGLPRTLQVPYVVVVEKDLFIAKTGQMHLPEARRRLNTGEIPGFPGASIETLQTSGTIRTVKEAGNFRRDRPPGERRKMASPGPAPNAAPPVHGKTDGPKEAREPKQSGDR